MIGKPTHRTAGGSFRKLQIFHFANYRFFISQITDFAKYRFSFRFVPFRFVSQITVSPVFVSQLQTVTEWMLYGTVIEKTV